MLGKTELQPAFLLHSRPYRDSSNLLEIFTRDYGRQGLIARGARRKNSVYRGLLQPFQGLLVSWGGRGELGTLHSAEPDVYCNQLTGHALWSGYYLNELLMRLCQRAEAYPSLFADYFRALELMQRPGQLQTALRRFEMRLLQELGYAPILDQDAQTGEPIRPEINYHYVAGEGPVAVPADSSPGAGLRISGQTMLALSTGSLVDGRGLKEAKTLLQGLLKPLLGDAPLKSRQTFRALLNAGETGPASG